MSTHQLEIGRLRPNRRRAAGLLALFLGGLVGLALAEDAPLSRYSDWPMFGQNLANTANGTSREIGPATVGKLRPKWVFTTQGAIRARAAVVSGSVFFPDSAGNLYRLDARTGALVWSKSLVSDYGLVPPSGSTTVISRTSPAVRGESVYIGSQMTASGAYLLAINTRDGSLKWKTQLDSHPFAVDTSSPVVLDDVVYTGVASGEEAAAANPEYRCCTFRGSAVAISANTGELIWKHYTTPPGYSGASVWGSSLIPDPLRGVVYATTGNNYTTPTSPDFVNCVSGRPLTDEVVTDCLSPDDLVDSVVALDMKSGELRWSHRMWTQDDWNVACLVGFQSGQANCPNPQGTDFDFASGANLWVTTTPHGPMTVLGAGQKSGRYSALAPDTGKLLWSTAVGPGSILGGMEWGSATDGQRIYVAIGNVYHVIYGGAGAGFWSALDPATGKVLWQTPDPNSSEALAPVTVANGVVYAASMAGTPTAQNMLALNAKTGEILWRFAAGGSVVAGPSVVDDTVYWGSGYSNPTMTGVLSPSVPGATSNNKFYAFGIPR
jgi:polyvinyl alcohol dehydrogenase (cytochrome)